MWTTFLIFLNRGSALTWFWDFWSSAKMRFELIKGTVYQEELRTTEIRPDHDDAQLYEKHNHLKIHYLLAQIISVCTGTFSKVI